MMVDADDLISCRIAEYVNTHQDKNGFYVRTGYVYFEGDNYMKVMPKFSSGTACIVNYSINDLPDRYPSEMTSNNDSNEFILRKSHGGVRRACIAAGRPLTPLPFKGAVYVLGTGENHSMHGKKGKYQTGTREFLEMFAIKHKIGKKLKKEFSIDWL